MAITIIKDYSFSFSKNDDYVYLSSDKSDEEQFRYGLHFLFNRLNCLNSDTNTIVDGYITVNTLDDLSSYDKGDLIYLYLNISQSSPVAIKLIDIEEVSLNNYKFYVNSDFLLKYHYNFYNYMALVSNNEFEIYKCITKKVAANSDGYGVFSINDITRELIEPNLLNNDSDDLTIDFYYLPFEEYLYEVNYNTTTISSSNSFNNFLVEDLDSIGFKSFLNPNEYIIIKDDNESFYNGVQKLITIIGTQGNRSYTTDKPALKGISNSGGIITRADNEASVITNDSDLSSEKTAFYSGLKLKDIAGLSNSELNDLTDRYINGNKYFSYSPKEQTTYLNDLGYLTLANNGNLTVEYKVTDSEGVEHIYDLDFSGGEDVFKVPSNPASINATAMTTNAARGLPVVQECDRSYKILNSYNNNDSDNLVLNGDFNNGIDNWASLGGGGVYLDNNTARLYTGASADSVMIRQTDVFEVGKTYDISYEITYNDSSDSVKFITNTITEEGFNIPFALGTHSLTYTYTGGDLQFSIGTFTPNSEIGLDNISVKESIDVNFYKFNIKKTTKFQNVRLLFSDLLGSLNGFNFALYSAKQFSTKKDTFTRDYQDFSNLNTIKFNNQSRGLTDLATFKTYKLVLNSDYLTQQESDYFEDLLSSNNVFAQYDGKVIAVNIPSKSVTIKDKIKGLIRYSLEVEFSISETRW